MSQINPAPDIKHLNDFISRRGKKILTNEEFQKRKLLNIVKKLAIEDLINAEYAKANIEAYYNDHNSAIKVLKNILKLTNNQSYKAWKFLLHLYIEISDIDAFIETYRLALKQDFENVTELHKLFKHVMHTYLITDINDNTELGLEVIDTVEQRINMLQELGISLPIYRRFMSIFYQEFYKYYDGVSQPLYDYQAYDLIIRIDTDIDNAKDLFDFNNHLQDVIMAWYSEANEEDQKQIEKVVIYIKHSSLIEQKGGIAA